MQPRTLLATGIIVGAALAGCGADDGAALLREARAKTLRAPYLSVTRGGRRVLLFSPGRTIIKRRGRMLALSGPTAEFTWDPKARCYHRHSEFNRDDLRQLRQGVAPPEIGGVTMQERDGMRVLAAREAHSDFADTEFEFHIDRSGRLVSMRERSAEFGVIAPGRWQSASYGYPTPAQFATLVGAAPRPRCA